MSPSMRAHSFKSRRSARRCVVICSISVNEQVMFAGMLSTYLREIGQVEEAREYADYVIEHGGTLALRETVMEDWT